MAEKRTTYKILLMGPQGSGKGTQAELLSDKLGVPAFSMGQLLRDEVASGSDIGKRIDDILTRGDLVSDDVAARVLKKRLEEAVSDGGYILDGYPRNMAQEAAFDFDTPTHVIVLEIPDDVSIRRLSDRLVCSTCGKVYSKRNNGHAVGDSCDDDGCDGALKQRQDDTPEAIKHRLNIYHEQTAPVIEKYEKQELVHRVDGTGAVEAVHMRILDVLDISYE